MQLHPQEPIIAHSWDELGGGETDKTWLISKLKIKRSRGTKGEKRELSLASKKYRELLL